MHMHMQMLTLSGVVFAASFLQAVAEGVRPFDGMVAEAHSLGTTAGSGAAAATTEALMTVT